MIPKETGLNFGQEGQGLNICDNGAKGGFYIVCILPVADKLQFDSHDLASCNGHGNCHTNCNRVTSHNNN